MYNYEYTIKTHTRFSEYPFLIQIHSFSTKNLSRLKQMYAFSANFVHYAADLWIKWVVDVGRLRISGGCFLCYYVLIIVDVLCAVCYSEGMKGYAFEVAASLIDRLGWIFSGC